MKHHTKEKGDTGVAFIAAHLIEHGIHVALPMSEHLPFDCIAISSDLRLIRVSVKYRAIYRGTITVPLKSSWSDKNGTHTVLHDKTTYDCIAIYCPDTRCCYYIRTNEIEGHCVSLRIDMSKNKQKKHIHLAKDFVNPNRIFASVMAAPSKR